MERMLLIAILSCFCINLQAQDWTGIPVPADAGTGKTWKLQEELSDDFSYSASFSSGGYATRSNFGDGKWNNFYHNAWDGPGYTYWNNSNVSVDGDNLVIKVGYTSNNSKGGAYGVASGCVTSNNTVNYPVYVEASLSVANISLASCFWLLSPDDTEEIDIIENYGGVNWYKNYTHISHHSFVRNPFTDYQPRDWNSWYPVSEVTAAGGWGPYCWNDGNRRYMRMGVNWIGPKHWEYYIEGELVRVMYYNAMATNMNGTWEYTYYNSVTADGNGYYMPTNGSNGYSEVTIHTTSTTYSLATLKAASNASNGYSVIDPGWFQGGDDSDLDGNGISNEPKGFSKDLQIIINMESQSWLTGSTPSPTDLSDVSKNQMKVDWVRVYKPVDNDPQTSENIIIEAENFLETGGNYNDGNVPYGVNDGGTKINWVNSGDWATYTINVTETGTYSIEYLISTPSDNAQIQFELDGTLVSTYNVPNNGQWDAYTTLKAGSNVSLATGSHSVKIIASGSNTWQWNLDKITLKPIEDIEVNPTSIELNFSLYNFTAINQSLTINATVLPTDATNKTVNWSTSNNSVATVSNGIVTARGEGSATITASTHNGLTDICNITVTIPDDLPTLTIEAEQFNITGGTYNGFQTYITSTGKEAINWNQTGDWGDYIVNIPTTGDYEVNYYVGTTVNGGAIEFILDGNTVMKDNVPNNGNWDSFSKLTAASTVRLTAGQHTIRLLGAGTNGWEWNMDKFILSEPNALKNTTMRTEFIKEVPVIKIYPNPTKDLVNISGLEDNSMITLYNLQGKIMNSFNSSEKEEVVDVSSYPSGIYLIRIAANKTQIFKINKVE